MPEIAGEITIQNTKTNNNQVTITLDKEQFEKIATVLKEENVAKARKLTQFRTDKVKDAFDNELNGKKSEIIPPQEKVKAKSEVKVAQHKKVTIDVPLPQPKKGFWAAYKAANIDHKAAKQVKEEKLDHQKSKVTRNRRNS